MIPVLATMLRNSGAWRGLALAAVLPWLAGCGSGLDIDRFWKEPRDLLVDRVEDARDAQQDAAETFRDALTEFKAVVGEPDAALAARYERLNAAFERSESAAGDISRRIDRVVSASNRLLDEWRDELDQYNDQALKRIAEQQFDQTRARADRLIEAMRGSEQRMQPVLDAFRDQVLYLKHNLNLSAITSLSNEAAVIETDVDALIDDMNRSIAEAEAFIEAMLDQG